METLITDAIHLQYIMVLTKVLKGNELDSRIIR